MDLRLYISALIAGVPKTGLTLADFQVDVYRIKKSDKSVTQVVTAAAMQFEVGSGFYGYFLAAVDFLTYDYLNLVRYTGAEALDTILWTGAMDTDVSSRVTLGAGAIAWTYTLTSSVDGSPIADADVWVTIDLLGAHVVASGKTDAFGKAIFHLDAGTYWIWAQKSGWSFPNHPDQEIVS